MPEDARRTPVGSARRGAAGGGWKRQDAATRPEPKILFQSYFKSVGPRTYAAQVKEAANRNQFLVLTEGKRDAKTGQVRKTSLFVYSEDFPAFFRLVKEAAEWIKSHPLPEDVKRQRERYWARQQEKSAPAARPPRKTAGGAG